MISMLMVLLTCSVILSILPSKCVAVLIPDEAAQSVFVSADHGLAFSFNAPDDSDDDLYFSLSGPYDRSWIAAGLKFQEIDNSLMIIVYPSSNGKNVTISPRLSCGHEEPVWTSELTIEVLAGSGVRRSSMIANGRCVNCRRWQNGALNLTSTTENMIFALGPTGHIKSDSLKARTQAHTSYGVFTTDMQRAIGPREIPTTANSSNSSASKDVKPPVSGSSDTLPLWHAVLMVFAFFLLMPFGVIILRIINSVRWHSINQSVAVVLAIVGTAIGLYMGLMYNRSKNLHTMSVHEVLGLIIVLLSIVQFVLGYWNHQVYKRKQIQTKMAPVHLWLGRIIIPVAVFNGFLGIPATLSSVYTQILVVITIVAAAMLLATYFYWLAKKLYIKHAVVRALSVSLNMPNRSHDGSHDETLDRLYDFESEVPGLELPLYSMGTKDNRTIVKTREPSTEGSSASLGTSLYKDC